MPDDVNVEALSIDGDPLTITTTSPGQNGHLTFSGTQGERIQMQVSGATMSAGWSLKKPDGTQLYYRNPGHGANMLLDTTVLPQSGTYTIDLDPTDTQVGSVTYQVLAAA